MAEKLTHAAEVFFCPRCGHSHLAGSRSGTRLYETGSIRCDQLIEVVRLSDWRTRIGAFRSDKLTEAGRALSKKDETNG